MQDRQDPTQTRDRRGKIIPPRSVSYEILSELAPIDGSYWQLCLHPFEYRRDLNPDLESLLENPLAANPFFNPAVLAASRDRITSNRIHQLVLWEKSGETELPRLSIPVTEGTEPYSRQHVLTSLTHDFAPLGDPLIGADTTSERSVLELAERFVELLRLAFENDMPPLILHYVDKETAFASALDAAASRDGLAIRSRFQGERASIRLDNNGNTDWHPSKKRRREYARLEKKLGQFGTITYERADDPFDVLLRLEEYLLLETRGWKGRKGTSIHAIKRDAAFARQSVMDMANTGNAEIFTLRLNDVAIASTILFHVHGCYYPWKTCFNETFAAFSPGTQLMLKLTGEITARPDFRYADSLAHFGTSWMSMLWPSRTGFNTYVIAPDPVAADSITDRMALGGKAKAFIKKLLRRN